ncbi:RNA recognition motif domain-containing protein [Pseudovibrio denitrificans]|uniref:RNA recognition motif domain-containing protein n=1 Tax=Pseudovibrio denitrificans TaxID=258256 RepID=UPI0039BF084E
MPTNSAHSTQPWHHHYATVLDALETTLSDAKNHCIGAPLPLNYQLKLQEVAEKVRELEALDPRNTQHPITVCAPVEHEKEQPVFVANLPFGLTDKVFSRLLRTTGEIKSISIHVDEDPQARVVSLHNGKLNSNWISMNDLEPPLSKQDPAALSIGAPAVIGSANQPALTSPASPAA